MALLVRPPPRIDLARASALAGALLLGACAQDIPEAAARPGLPELPSPAAALEPGLAALLREPYEAARAAPDDARAVAEYGVALEANQQLEAAVLCYARAAALEPAEPLYLFHEAYVRERLGDWDGALAMLRGASEAAPACAPLQHRLGTLELQTGDLDAAERAFRRTIAAAPEDAEGYAGLGTVQLRRELFRDAVASLEEAVRLLPGHGSAWYRLGLAYRGLGETAKAERALERGVGASDHVLAGPLHARLEAYDASRFGGRRRAAALLDEGHVERALETIRELLARFPDDARGQVLHARILAAAGRTEEATAALATAEDLEPGSVALHVERARQALDGGRFDDALVAALRAVELAPEVASAHAALGDVRARRGEHALAISSLREALTLEPMGVDARRALARSLCAAGRAREALAEYDVLAGVLQRSADLHLERAAAARDAGQVAEARSSLFLARTYGADAAAVKALEETLP